MATVVATPPTPSAFDSKTDLLKLGVLYNCITGASQFDCSGRRRSVVNVAILFAVMSKFSTENTEDSPESAGNR